MAALAQRQRLDSRVHQRPGPSRRRHLRACAGAIPAVTVTTVGEMARRFAQAPGRSRQRDTGASPVRPATAPSARARPRARPHQQRPPPEGAEGDQAGHQLRVVDDGHVMVGQAPPQLPGGSGDRPTRWRPTDRGTSTQVRTPFEVPSTGGTSKAEYEPDHDAATSGRRGYQLRPAHAAGARPPLLHTIQGSPFSLKAIG